MATTTRFKLGVAIWLAPIPVFASWLVHHKDYSFVEGVRVSLTWPSTMILGPIEYMYGVQNTKLNIGFSVSDDKFETTRTFFTRPTALRHSLLFVVKKD